MHDFAHELRVARINGVFSSIDANQGDMLLGWDTDEFPFNVYDATYCMLEVLKEGGFKNGGLNFDAKTRRQSNTSEDILLAYITGMDTFALGLRIAAKIIEDGRIDEFKDDRYRSYKQGIGKKIVDNDITFEELDSYARGLTNIEVESGRQEYLQEIINNIIFSLYE